MKKRLKKIRSTKKNLGEKSLLEIVDFIMEKFNVYIVKRIINSQHHLQQSSAFF